MSCLAEDMLASYRAGGLSSHASGEVERHLASCDACRQRARFLAQGSGVAQTMAAGSAGDAQTAESAAAFDPHGQTLAAGSDGDHAHATPAASAGSAITMAAETGAVGTAGAPAPELPRGTTIGRYMVRDVLGKGGMGVVYAAYDPELDRKVAVKVLRAEIAGDDAATRLLREGRAIAKLAHPNVVAVFDVGTYAGSVFVAMELVDGRSLDVWLDERRRPWREIVAVFLQAGAGLVAAHAVGMVHRDFKPANVLMGNDGRARVTDFGLARITDGDVRPAGTSPAANDMRLTQTGALVGTPAYMAAEQFEGGSVDARTDQFSYCVALYEGLYGERPFEGTTLAALQDNVTTERVRPVPADAAIPAWLRAVVLRGLRADPAARYASLDELLAALRADPSVRRRRRTVVASIVVALAATAGTTGWLARDHDRGPSRLAVCKVGAQRISDAWGPASREKARTAFAAIGGPVAEQAWQRVHEELDGYSSRWTAAWNEACQVGEHSPQLGGLGLSCLDDRRRELDALVTTLATADAKMVPKAVVATSSLPSVTTCADARYLLATTKPSDVKTPVTQAIAKELAIVRAHLELGRYEPGREAARRTIYTADTLGPRVLRADARLQLGRIEAAKSETEAARVNLETAVEHALASGHDELAFAAWRQLAYHFGYVKGEFEAADRWLGLAAAAVERLGSPGHLRADLEFARASVDLKRPGYADARKRFLGALEIYEREPSSELSRIRTLSNLAVAEWELQEYAAAREHQGKACELMESKLGALHPNTATCFMNFGVDLRTAGELDAADTMFTRAIAHTEKALGADHPSLGIALLNRGKLRTQRRQLVEARSDLDRAQMILDAAKLPEVADALTSLGVLAAAAGNGDEARKFYGRVVTLLRAKPGSETKLAIAMNNLGNSELADGKLAAARTALQSAQALFTRHAGPAHPFTIANLGSLAVLELTDDHAPRAVTLLQGALAAVRSRESTDAERGAILANLGFAHARARSFADARAAADQALGLLGTGLETAEARGYARFALAIATRKTDRTKSRELASQARTEFEALGPNGQRSLDLLGAWQRKK